MTDRIQQYLRVLQGLGHHDRGLAPHPILIARAMVRCDWLGTIEALRIRGRNADADRLDGVRCAIIEAAVEASHANDETMAIRLRTFAAACEDGVQVINDIVDSRH